VTGIQLVRGRAVLTGRPDQPEVNDGAVAISGSRIVAVGPSSELTTQHPDATQLGGDDRIVIPGLVSAHQHGSGASSVQLGCGDQPFERWLIEMLRIPPLDVRSDTAYHAVRLLENGITTTIHSHYVRDPARYDDEVAAILAGYRDVGTRVAFAPHYIDRNFLTYGDDEPFIASLPAELHKLARGLCVPPIGLQAYLDLVVDLTRNLDADRERALFGPVAPQWCAPDALEQIGAVATTAGLGAHLHLLETRAQRAYLDREFKVSIVGRLDEVGLLRPGVSLAHGVQLWEGEIALIAERGATVVLNPGCNLRLGNGTAPVAALMNAGVRLAVGTDDMTLGDDDDLLGEVALVAGLARSAGVWPDAAQLLQLATVAGAEAAGFAAEVGTLEPGRRADIVLLDAGRIVEPALTEAPSMLELTMARARAGDVREVLLNGQLVVAEGAWRGDRAGLVAAVHDAAESQTAEPSHARLVEAVGRIAAARAAWNGAR
jgi:cytosine/adenosine deaminase-related metal-dependent hydrolase